MRNKQHRFAENEEAINLIQEGKPSFETIQGQWFAHFGNSKPLVLELACGYGEYTVGLALHFQDQNFIGVDIKGARIWKGSQQALELGLANTAFLRTFIQNLDNFFAPQEVSEIWITFPDPRPKAHDSRRRLTHPRLLHLYQRLLKPGGTLHLKTDSEGLFRYSLAVLQNLGAENLAYTEDLYGSPFAALHKGITTKYERLYLAQGLPIKYLQCQLPAAWPTLDYDTLEPEDKGYHPKTVKASSMEEA